MSRQVPVMGTLCQERGLSTLGKVMRASEKLVKHLLPDHISRFAGVPQQPPPLVTETGSIFQRLKAPSVDKMCSLWDKRIYIYLHMYTSGCVQTCVHLYVSRARDLFVDASNTCLDVQEAANIDWEGNGGGSGCGRRHFYHMLFYTC